MTTEERRVKLRELKQDFEDDLIDEQMYQDMKNAVNDAFRAGLS